MLNSVALEVGIGLILCVLVFSLLMSAFVEMLETVLKHRAIDLQRALAEMLDDLEGTGARRDLMNHPLLWGLYRGSDNPPTMASTGSSTVGWRTGRDLPSYIPSDLFAAAFVSLMEAAPKALDEKESTEAKNQQEMVAPTVIQTWQVFEQRFPDESSRLQAVARWYEAVMERASGWYKRRSQRILFWGGLGVAVLLNMNLALVGAALATSEVVRRDVVAGAEQQLAQRANDLAYKKDASNGLTSLQSAGLPIGWSGAGSAAVQNLVFGSCYQKALGIVFLLCGWIGMALAATMGAPFWFDLLGRFVAVRASIKPSAESGGSMLTGRVLSPHDPTRAD